MEELKSDSPRWRSSATKRWPDRRADAQLIELAESQRTMQEHAQIISAKYQRAKTEIEQILWRYLLENCADFHSLSEAGGCRAVRSETEACVDDIRLCTELVGEGQFGQVRLGVTPMGATVAVKVISKAKVRSLHALRSLAEEVAAIRALSLARVGAAGAAAARLMAARPATTPGGPVARARLAHVVRLHEVRVSSTFVYLIQEAGGCDLYQLLGQAARHHALSPLVSAAIARGLSAGVAAMHAHSWCHRDIKPENVLLGGDLDTLSALAQRTPSSRTRVHVRLCDFGIAARPPRDGGPASRTFAARLASSRRAPHRRRRDDQLAELVARGANAAAAQPHAPPTAHRARTAGAHQRALAQRALGGTSPSGSRGGESAPAPQPWVRWARGRCLERGRDAARGAARALGVSSSVDERVLRV